MTKPIQVGDLVISHTTTLARAKVGRPALVIEATESLRPHNFVLLRVGDHEWWQSTRFCEKVPD